MSRQISFEGVDDAVKPRLVAYWAETLQELETLLAPYPKDLQDVRLTVSHHRNDPGPPRYEARAVVALPTGTMAAEAEDEDPQVALDRLTDALVPRIRKHKERVRRDYLFRRKSRSRADLSAAGPRLQRDKADGDREDFLRLLRPHLHDLRHHARRELRMLEHQGLLHGGEVTADDLLDEALVRAWQRFPDRPRGRELDLWLAELLQDILAEWVAQEPRKHASLEGDAAEVVPDGVPREDEPEWWADLLGDEETFTLGDLIPDVEETGAWERLEAEEQVDRLLSLMSDLPPARRQAFLLHALEDYSTAEIAAIQGRPEDRVEADIEAARRALRGRLLAGGYAREAGEPATAAKTGGD